MTQVVSKVPEISQPEDISRVVERVYSLALRGIPRVLVVDAAAIWEAEGDGDLVAAILAKLRVLAQQDGTRILVRGVEPWQATALEREIPRVHLVLEWRTEEGELTRRLPGMVQSASQSLAILATTDTVAPEHCTAFYVGSGEAPEHAHTTWCTGAQAADCILGLYGTALMQERAGIAFRAISAGQRIPREATVAPEVLSGVVRSVERHNSPSSPGQVALPNTAALRDLAGRAYARLQRNVLPSGAIVGSPAKGREPGQPNYWFYWQRDGSVTMGHLIEWHRQPPLGLGTASLRTPIEHYPDFVARTQGSGALGTSRYTIDGTPITGFGNPQLDGPPLTVMTLARMESRAAAWELMQACLDFLLTPEGQGPSMDAWEFIYGWHFNAAFLKRRALLIGAAVADQLGHGADGARYRAEAGRTEALLDQFIDPTLGRLRAYSETYSPWFPQMSGLDMAIICALLSGRDLLPGSVRDMQSGHAAGRLRRDLDSLTHPAVLATMNALEDAYQEAFSCNRDWAAGGNAGFGLGRFPEDANDGVGSSGGNPWPLATLWAAQFYYHVANEVSHALQDAGGAPIVIEDSRQVAFFQRATGNDLELAGSVAATTWRERVLPALIARGDGYLNFVVHHLPADGGVTEQIDRDTGQPRGARDLSWALSELIATIVLREQVGQVA